MDERRTLLQEEEGPEGMLQLWAHHMEGRAEYELVVNGVFIMATYNALSSELLVRRALKRVQAPQCRLLIGGLGLGFSVREACGCAAVEAIHVVELNDSVIRWNRTALAELNGAFLLDPRVRVTQGDFVAYVQNTGEQYDAVCMDIDNGPMLLARWGNRQAYSVPFYRRVKAILRDRGIFVIWSCNREPALQKEMGKVFSRCWEEKIVERHQGRGVPYYLYFGKK